MHKSNTKRQRTTKKKIQPCLLSILLQNLNVKHQSGRSSWTNVWSRDPEGRCHGDFNLASVKRARTGTRQCQHQSVRTHTWSGTWSRSQSIRRDAPAGCLRTWTCGGRGRVCAAPLSGPRVLAASRWRPAAARRRTGSPAGSAACCHTEEKPLVGDRESRNSAAASGAGSSTWQFHHTCCCRSAPSDWLLALLRPAPLSTPPIFGTNCKVE